MLDYLEGLARADDLDTVWALHCTAMVAFGFDRLIYGYSRFGTKGSLGALEDVLYLTNHDQEYLERFIGDRLFVSAPLTRWANENVGACSWGAQWSDPSRLTEKERDVIAFNRSMNVTAGYTISFPDPNPRSHGLIAMTARAGLSQNDVDAIWAVDGRLIEAMNHMAHLKILSLPHKTARARLSERQREVLSWVGAGKSNQDIATILGVAVPTVEKHLRLAREKLGVETTAQAVLKATIQNRI